MTILDSTLEFSDAQALTTQTTTASTDVVDCNIADANLGAGTPKRIVVEVNTLFASSGSATLAVLFQDSADNSSWVTRWTTQTFALSVLTAGKKLAQWTLPANHLRYVRIAYTIGSAAFTAGKVDAYICLDEDTAT